MGNWIKALPPYTQFFTVSVVQWGLGFSLPLLAVFGAILAASLVTAWWWRAQGGEPGRAAHWLAMTLSAVTLTGLATLYGPVFVVPALAMINGVLFGAQMDFQRPVALVAFNVLPVAFAATLQALGVLPGGVEVHRDHIVVRAGMTYFSPAVAWTMMSLSAVATVVFPHFVLARLRRRGEALERRHFMQAWHLRNLLHRDAAPDAMPTRSSTATAEG